MLGHASGVHIGSGNGAVRVGILVLGNLQGLEGELLWIARLIEDGLPHEYAGVVTVAADNGAGVLVYFFIPARLFVPVLPTWGSHDDEEAQLVAGIHKGGVLRIVGSTDDGEARIA